MRVWGKWLVSVVLFLGALGLVRGAEPPAEALQSAHLGLATMLDHIPEGKEAGYGFEDRDQFALATLGPAWQMLSLPRAGLDAGADVSTSLVPTGEWRFPVLVKGKMRVLLTVALTDSGWEAVSLGGTGLASELQTLTDGGWVPAAGPRGILRLYTEKADFAVTGIPRALVQQTVFRPLSSARLAIPGVSSKRELTLSELIPLLRETTSQP